MRVAATMRTNGGGRVVPAAVPAGIALAWAALLLAELVRAPLSHDELAGGPLPPAAAVAVFAAGWVAMVAAMMLPSSYPLVRAYAAIAARAGGVAMDARGARRQGGVAGFLGGYVAVWTAFGLALFAGDLGLHAVLDGSSRPFAGHATLLGNALLIAGAFQLTNRKRRCLDRCRHPGDFLRHHGAAGAGGSAWGASTGSTASARAGR
jgi:predicted metal-binding membrane protein